MITMIASDTAIAATVVMSGTVAQAVDAIKPHRLGTTVASAAVATGQLV